MSVYPRYTWVGNRISSEDMEAMYHIRRLTGKTITLQVAEAVQQYVQANGKDAAATASLGKNPQTR